MANPTDDQQATAQLLPGSIHAILANASAIHVQHACAKGFWSRITVANNMIGGTGDLNHDLSVSFGLWQVSSSVLC